jgi:hypothetical protein
LAREGSFDVWAENSILWYLHQWWRGCKIFIIKKVFRAIQQNHKPAEGEAN